MAAGIIKALFGFGKMKTVPWTQMTPELHNQLSSQLGKLMFVVKSQNLKLTKFQQDYLMNQLKHMDEFEKRVLSPRVTKDTSVDDLLKGPHRDERGRVWDFGTKDRPFPGFTPEVIPGGKKLVPSRTGKKKPINVNYTEAEKKLGFPIGEVKYLEDLVDIEKMGMKNYYNLVMDRADEIRKRMRVTDEGGTKIPYREFETLQKELNEIDALMTRVRKEVPADKRPFLKFDDEVTKPDPEDLASGGIARVGMFGGKLVTEGIKAALKRTHKAYDNPGADFAALMDSPSYLLSPVNMQKIKKLELYRKQLVRDILRKEGGGKFTHGPKPEATRADLKLLDEYIAKLKNKISKEGYYGEGAAAEKATIKERPDLPFSKFVRDKYRHASGGIARVGYLKGKLVKGILSLGKKKKPKINRKLTKDELDDLYEEFDEAVPYPMETVRDKEKFLKAVKDEEAYMFQQYKKGNLDPKPGEPGRKQFLEKKLEEMELSGDKRLMTIDEIEELSSFDLGTEMDEAIKKYKQKDIQQKRELQTFDVTGRKKNASGGIAGELHLNEGGRVSFIKGGKVSSGLAKILGV